MFEVDCQMPGPPSGGRRCGARRGLTVLEFVGCAIAVLGGAWLGALYLGVTMKHVAHAALSETEMLDNVPEDWRPEDPRRSAMTHEQLVTTLRSELGTLRSEIAALRTNDTGEASAVRSSHEDARAKQATLAYWQRLSDIAASETALQRDAETAFDPANAANVFAIKSRISRFAANSVRAIPTANVDPTATQFGEQLGGWYERAGNLYERAVQIWEAPGTTQSRAKLNKEWRAAELHHRNEARLIHERASGVRGNLTRQYGEDFPEFAAAGAVSPPASERESTTAVDK